MFEQEGSLEARVAALERLVTQLVADASIGAAVDGKFAHKWPARVMGPEGDAYILAIQAGVVVAIPAAEVTQADWTPTGTTLDLPAVTLNVGTLNFTGLVDGDDDSEVIATTVSVEGGLTVGGDINFEGNLDGSATSDLYIQDAHVEGDMEVLGSVTSALTVAGVINANAGITVGDGFDVDFGATGELICPDIAIEGVFKHTGSTVGFYGTTPGGIPTITGSRGGNAALTDLLASLAFLGLIVDSSSV